MKLRDERKVRREDAHRLASRDDVTAQPVSL
jgi:hypothetical protein